MMNKTELTQYHNDQIARLKEARMGLERVRLEVKQLEQQIALTAKQIAAMNEEDEK